MLAFLLRETETPRNSEHNTDFVLSVVADPKST